MGVNDAQQPGVVLRIMARTIKDALLDLNWRLFDACPEASQWEIMATWQLPAALAAVLEESVG